jgi:hypothetical protein
VLALQIAVFGATKTTTSKTHTSKKASVHTTSTHTAKHTSTSSRHTTAKKAARPRGQAAPDSDRTREIQNALIREHYLNGSPSGSWDSDTRAALTKFQADHGWQTKIVPDSRALIKLGLGPSREGLLNPDTAAISPHELGAENPQPGGSSK